MTFVDSPPWMQEFGTLVGHFAIANGHCQATTGETMVVFSGPHAYVSLTWYRAENTVPTWNCVAVHASGTLELVREPDRIIESLVKLVEQNESSWPAPWTFDPSSDFARMLASRVIGFRVPITRLEGKWKLSQNHPVARRELVVETLSTQGDKNSLAIAQMMREQIQ